MADPVSITASVLAVVTAAIQSTNSLKETVRRFRERNKTLGRLQDELEDLSKILGLLEHAVNTDASVPALLHGPTARCSQLCREFEDSLKVFTGKARTGFRDWTRMEFMRGDINEFIDTIAGYKSTISVGLGTITMHTSKVSYKVLEEYNELIKDTSYNLEEHLQRIDAKLAKLTIENSDSLGGNIDLNDERAVTKQCLRICEDARSYIESLTNRESVLRQDTSQDVTDEAAVQQRFNVQRLTRQALDENQKSFVKEIIRRIQQRLEDLLVNEDSGDDNERLRLQEDLDISRQCLEVCEWSHNQREAFQCGGSISTSSAVEGPRSPGLAKMDTFSRLAEGFISGIKGKGEQARLRRDHPTTLPGPPEMTFVRHGCEILGLVGQMQQVKSFLGGLLTLTAKDGVVKAMRCDDYLHEVYGDIGRELLDCICRAIEDPKRKYDGADMKAEISESEVVLHYRPRISPDITEDALSWLCLALRIPPKNGIHASFLESQRLSPLCLLQAPGGGGVGGDNRASCWHNLFETAVVVVSGETSQSVLENCLEINSDIMIQLAAVHYPVSVGGGLVLLGYSTALIPLERMPNGEIKWHLEVNTKDSQFKVSDLPLQGKHWYTTTTFNDLRGTALLGWSAKAEVLLGTEKLPCQVTWSSTQRKYHRWELNNINLQAVAQSTVPFQIGGQAGFSFQRIPNTVRFSPSRNYTKLLVDSFKEPMILYDTGERRGWLVSKLSVLHHMVLTYCKTSGVKGDYPLASPEGDGGSASFRALLQWAEKDLVGHGGVCLRVDDLILGFSTNLSKTAIHPPKGAEIYGYEFMDIVHTTTTSELRKARLKRDGLVWKPLLKNIECLFCNNLGDAIVSMRSLEMSAPCNRLPKNRDLLAASLFCVDEISKREGNVNDTSIRRLSGTHLWELWGDPFAGCSHTNKASDCWNNDNFIQDISREKRKFLKTHHEFRDPAGKAAEHANCKVGGVVVFGQSRAKAARTGFLKLGIPPSLHAQGKGNPGLKVRKEAAVPQTTTPDSSIEAQRPELVCRSRPTNLRSREALPL